MNIKNEMEKYDELLSLNETNNKLYKEYQYKKDNLDKNDLNYEKELNLLSIEYEMPQLFWNIHNLRIEIEYKEKGLLETFSKCLINIYNDLDDESQNIIDKDLKRKGITFYSTDEDTFSLDYDISYYNNEYYISYYDGMQAPWTILKMPRDIHLLYDTINDIFQIRT